MSDMNVEIKQEVGKVEFTNYEEIKGNIANMMVLYKDAKFGDDDIPYARKEVATLRKMETAIDDKRKEVKKKCMEPYDEFERKAKELQGIIDEPVQLINKQIDAYMERWKEERRKKIRETYAATIDGFEEYLPLKRIYDSKWENKATSLKSIQSDINKVVDSTAQAINAITAMNSDAVEKALAIYKNDLSLTSAIAYVNDYEAKKAEILRREEEKKRQEEQRRIEQERIAEQHRREEEQRRIEQEHAEVERKFKEEARKRAEAEARAEMEAEKEKQRIAAENFSKAMGQSEPVHEDKPQDLSAAFTVNKTVSESENKKKNIVVKVLATAEELEQLKMFMDSIGIDYEV